MESLFFVLFVGCTGLFVLLLVLRLAAIVVPRLVGSVAGVAWNLLDSSSRLLGEVRFGAHDAWQGMADERFSQNRIEEILKEAAAHGMPGKQSGGINQQVVDSAHAMRLMKHLWNGYYHSVATCLELHHYYKNIYLQVNPTAQHMSEVADHEGLQKLRQNVSDYTDACVTHLQRTDLKLHDHRYAKTLFGLEFMRQQCGVNCPLLDLPINSLPRRCGPGVFVGLP